MNYQIGLDFGTKQTKVCLYNLTSGIHQFHIWPNGSLFFPSRIGFTRDEKFIYGDIDCQNFVSEFNYFKMATLDDLVYYEQSKYNAQFLGVLYSDAQFMEDKGASLSPSFLCTIYIAYVLKLIESEYKVNSEKTKSGGLFGGTPQAIPENEIRFTVQLGIPTEWSRQINLIRRWKFESILFIAWQLKDKYRSLDDFRNSIKKELEEHIVRIIAENNCNEIIFRERLNDIGLSVFPESAAGLFFLTKNKKLEQGGLYATMDIGAGTTDVSYFSVTNNHRIGYFASESFTLASNSIYERYAKSALNIDFVNQGVLRRYEDITRNCLFNNNVLDEHLDNSLYNVYYDLQKLFRMLYSRSVGIFKLRDRWEGRPILMFGGGSRFKLFQGGHMEYLHIGGVKGQFMSMRQILDYSPDRDIDNQVGTWENEFPILVVSLGLSYPKPLDEQNWVERRGEEVQELPIAEKFPHPVNEDCYIYDVLRQD